MRKNNLMEQRVSRTGLLVAAGMWLAATIGSVVTQTRTMDEFNGFWLACYLCSMLTLSGAAVDFDPKRLIK